MKPPINVPKEWIEGLRKTIKLLRRKYSNDLSLSPNDLIIKLETLDDVEFLIKSAESFLKP